MKNFTKLFGIIALAAVIVFSMIACEDVADDKLDFDYQEYDGFIYITGYRGAGGNVIIPSKIDGKPVTCIGAPYDLHGGAFKDCTSLTGITIPDSVITLGANAFSGCVNLASVTIGNRVSRIEGNVFYHCSSLTSITIPDSVTLIGVYAFYGCSSLAGVTIGNSVTDISLYAFDGCTSLTSIIIPSSVRNIESGAFENCTNLTRVTFQAAGIEGGVYSTLSQSFHGDLGVKYLAGGAGTYTTTAPVTFSSNSIWTKEE